jgi:hypothetical protein
MRNGPAVSAPLELRSASVSGFLNSSAMMSTETGHAIDAMKLVADMERNGDRWFG